MSDFKLWAKRHSPELLLTSAIINSAASVVLASLATKNLTKVTTPAKKNIVKLHSKMDKCEKDSEDFNKHKSELNKLYFKTGLKIAGIYAPAVLSFGLSTASMIGSHNIMKGRNAALAAAFMTLKGGYDAYRQRVRDKIGDTAEEAIYEGITEKKVTEIDKDGNKETKTTKTFDDDRLDKDFGVFWGPGNDCCGFEFSECNMTILLQKEALLNQLLEAQGHLFLADVYKELGCTPSMLGKHKLQASHVLGWVFDKDNPNGDNYISFGIHDSNGELTKQAKRFQQGLEDFIWLDFNYDGDILTGDNGNRTFMETAIRKDSR